MKLYKILRITFVIAIILVPAILMAQSFDTHEYIMGQPDDLKLSNQCKGCHKDIYDEWSETMHAKASYTKDPLHNTMKEAFEHSILEKEGTPGYFCAHCHTPMVNDLMGVISGQVTLADDDERQMESIGCHFCHSIESVHDGMPSAYYKISADGSVQGPGRSTKTIPFHEITKNPLFDTLEVCSGCHGYLKNDKGISICSLKEEEWDGVSKCQDCHMQEVGGKPSAMSERTTHKSHLMSGGHVLEKLNTAATLSIDLEKSKEIIKTVVKATNKTAHKLPSTMPFRLVVLKVTASDSSGNVVWSNFKEDPMTEDRQAVLMKIFGAGDKVGVPTWEADKIVMDTRISSGDTRSFKYEIPAKDVTQIDAVLIYFVVPPPAMEQFNLEPDGYIEQPHPIAQVSVNV